MMDGWITKHLSRTAFNHIWKTYLSQLIYRDDKIRPKRLIIAISIVLLGLGLYYLPEKIPWLAEGFHIYNPENPSLEDVSRIVYFLDHNKDYMSIFQYMIAFSYLTILALLTILTIRSRHIELDAIIKDQKELFEFAQAVKLSDGSRCAKEQERSEIFPVIAEKIKKSHKVRIMAVSAYHDLVDGNSQIRHTLEEKEHNLNLRVLLLDPYSEYAQQRAEELLPGEDPQLAWMRYIYDSCTVKKELDHIKQRGGSVEYRHYCSKPFFRMHLLDRDLFIQAYESKKHGHASPMYHYEAGDNSLFHLGEEMFNYHWKRGFLFDSELLGRKGKAFTVFLAKQYGLLLQDDDISKTDKLREEIIHHAKEKTTEANSLFEQGLLPNVD